MKLEEIRKNTLKLRTPTNRRVRNQNIPRVEITREQLFKLESLLNRLFNQIGIDVVLTTTHFIARANQIRGDGPIYLQDIRDLFQKAYTKYNKKIVQYGKGFEAVLRDIQTNLNVPFILDWDRETGRLDIIAKTAMKKRDFRSVVPIWKV